MGSGRAWTRFFAQRLSAADSDTAVADRVEHQTRPDLQLLVPEAVRTAGTDLTLAE